MTGKINEIPRRGQDLLGALRHIEAGVGERHLAWPPLDQIGVDLALELADLHRQGRLRDRALGGGAAKVPVSRERSEITQLTQRDHSDKLILSHCPINTIRPDRLPSLKNRN
jgi:hypothetical protein